MPTNEELIAEVSRLKEHLGRYEAYMKRVRREANMALGAPPPVAEVVSAVVPKVEAEPQRECSENLQATIHSWLAYKGKKLSAVGKQRTVSRIHKVADAEGEDVVISSIELAMGNGWVGWDFPDSRNKTNGLTNSQRKFETTKTAVQRRLDELEEETCLQQDVPF